MRRVHFADMASDQSHNVISAGGRQLSAIPMTTRAGSSALRAPQSGNPPYGRQINAEPIVIRAGESNTGTASAKTTWPYGRQINKEPAIIRAGEYCARPTSGATAYPYGRQINKDPIIIRAGESTVARPPSIPPQHSHASTKALNRSIATKPSAAVATSQPTPSERRENCRELLQRLTLSQNNVGSAAKAPSAAPAPSVSQESRPYYLTMRVTNFLFQQVIATPSNVPISLVPAVNNSLQTFPVQGQWTTAYQPQPNPYPNQSFSFPTPAPDHGPFVWGSAKIDGNLNFSNFEPWTHPGFFLQPGIQHYPDPPGGPFSLPIPPTDAREFLAGSLPEPSARHTPTLSTSIASVAPGSKHKGGHKGHKSDKSHQSATRTHHSTTKAGGPGSNHDQSKKSHHTNGTQRAHLATAASAPAPVPTTPPTTGTGSVRKTCATCLSVRRLVDVQGVGTLCQTCLYAHTGAEYHRLASHASGGNSKRSGR